MIAVASDMKQALASLRYELATTATKTANWQKAIQNYEIYLKETNEPDRTCITCFELAMAHACAGDNENAKKYFQLSVDRNRKDAVFELYASRKSREYLAKGGTTTFDKVIYEARNRMTVNAHAQVITLLLEKLSKTDLTNPDETAVYNLLLGTCYRKTNDSENAFKFLIAAYKEKTKNEPWVQPFSLVECAELEILQNNLEQGKKAIETAKNFKDYNFQSELSQRMARLMDIINGVQYKI